MNIENSEVPKQPNITPKKHTGLRVGLAGLVGFLGTASGVSVWKFLEHEASKQKTSAQSQQAEGKIPSERAYEELVGTSIGTVIPAEEPTPTASATKAPESTPTPTIKRLTPRVGVLSSTTVDIKTIDIQEVQELYQKAVDKGENKIPVPVDLGENGIIEEYMLPNGVRGLAIKNLKVGETYTIVAPTDGKADGRSRKDILKYNPRLTTTAVNFQPTHKNPDAKYLDISYGFPLNASIAPKYLDPFNENPRKEFKTGEILAILTVNSPDSPEQKEFEALFGPGASMVLGFGTQRGINREPIQLSEIFLQDSQGRPVVLNPAIK